MPDAKKNARTPPTCISLMAYNTAGPYYHSVDFLNVVNMEQMFGPCVPLSCISICMIGGEHDGHMQCTACIQWPTRACYDICIIS